MSTRTARWLALIATGLLVPLAQAATWHVELDGSGDFTAIQPAVDVAAAGDTIRIGPGRFATFHPIGLPGYTDEVIVHVTKPNLVFIGAGAGVTRIGTADNYVPYGLAPRVFFALAPNDFSLRDVTLENVYRLVMTNAVLVAEQCAFVGGDARIACLSLEGSGRIEDCDFGLPTGGTGISLRGGLNGFVVRDCRFVSASHFDAISCAFGPRNVSISNCTVERGRVGFYAATGSVSQCNISCIYGQALYVGDPSSSVSYSDVTVDGAPIGLQVQNSSCTAERLALLETSDHAIRTTGRSEVVIHNSNIIPSAGWAVYCDVTSAWPTHTLDLRNNNWGVTDAAAIDAMIWDHRDSPSNPCTVLYEPYVGQPVSVESSTWGDLKASFR